MLSKADVRAIVAEELGVPPESIGDNQDLVHLGVHSMLVMHLSARWRKAGYQVRSSELVLEPTVSRWSELLAGNRKEQGQPVPAAPSAPSEQSAQDEEFPLATMQHAYWVGRRGDQSLGGVAAHLYAEFDGSGLAADRLGRAARLLVRRHEQLRVQFTENGTQRVLPEPLRPVFHVVDASGDSDAGEAVLERLRQEKSHQKMAVDQGQVVDITLTLLPEGRHRLHIDVDMLAADALSYRRILDDLAQLYEAEAGLASPVGYTYREYLRAKRRPEAEVASAKAWWSQRLDSLPQTPSLPALAEEDRADASRSFRLHHWFGPEAKARLNSLAHSHGVTPAVALASVFSEVVARWSAQQRFLLNVPLFDREPLHEGVDHVVGDFTNSVLVDSDARRIESMAERAKRLQRELHSCVAHASYEGLDVLRELGRLRGGAVTPSVVFTSGLNLGELFSERVERIFGNPVWILSQGPQVDLDAQVVELAGGLLVNWDVRRDAMPEGVVETMFEAFRSLLLALVAPNADWAAPLSIPLPGAQRATREAANSTKADFGARTLHEAFFTLAEQEPDRVALLWRGGGSCSYGELSAQALAVAGALAEAGVRAGDTVAVAMPKGHRQIPAVLGVLALGAAYVPVGANQPAARRERILARAGAKVALVDGAFELPGQVSALPLDQALAASRLASPQRVEPSALAYVLFTSGSTGEPKGVEVRHSAAANTIDALAARFAIGFEDRLIGLSALEFDLSVFDIFCPLSSGGALVCVDEEIDRDAAAWAELVAGASVSVVNCAPGLIGMLLDAAAPSQLQSVRLVLTGGDRVQTELARRFQRLVPGLRFVGLGGATEAAIHSTVCEVDEGFPPDWANVPYGFPLANVLLRVVNERGEDSPDQVVGELWIGGASVADGYRGDPERTSARFVEHSGTRWYRTGDLARVLPDGTVDFLGRADHQVKIRGHRVELGEVESALVALPEVREAVATVAGSGRLAAAVTLDNAAPFGGATDGIKDALRAALPAHMIPEILEVLDAIPLTANGKLDRAAVGRALEAGPSAAQAAQAPPANEVEAAVAYIAAQVLEVEQIGVETDFLDAGGNSILATRLTAQIRSLLSVEKFAVADVLEGRTARRIGEVLAAREAAPGRLERVSAILLELVGVQLPQPATAG